MPFFPQIFQDSGDKPDGSGRPDDGKEDDKVLAVPVGEPDYADVHNFTQIFSHQLRKIQHFFETYKLLEGKHTSTGGWEDAATARRVIDESAQRFSEQPG